MLELTQQTEIRNADEDVINTDSQEKMSSAGNDKRPENKNAAKELFEEDLYVWNLLLFVDEKKDLE